MQETNHIYPIFDKMMTRQDKESLLHQKGVMVWFTGVYRVKRVGKKHHSDCSGT